MYRQQNSPIMAVVQTIFFLIVLGAVLFVGFYVFLALLPFILIFIAYIWYKYKKAVKAFKEGQANGEYRVYENSQEGPFVKQSLRYVYTNNQGTNFNAQSHESLHSERQNLENNMNNSANSQNNPETVIYDIAPEDYTVEEKK